MQGHGVYFLIGEESRDITCGVRKNASSHGERSPLSHRSEVRILFAKSESVRRTFWRGSEHLGLEEGNYVSEVDLLHI